MVPFGKTDQGYLCFLFLINKDESKPEKTFTELIPKELKRANLNFG